jgi:large subunit ribosomal protein L1
MAEAKKTPAKKAAVKKVAPKTAKTTKKAPKSEVKTAEKIAVKETSKKIKDIAETEAIAETIAESEKELNTAEKPIAKAGKRSPKSLKQTEEKAVKEAKKAHKEGSEESKPKAKPVHVRTRLERRAKKYRKVAELIDKSKEYSVAEALKLAVKTSPVKFDATVEIHVRLGVDPKQADQNIRANLVLPSGTGKSVKVAVFAENEDAEKAKKAGADIVGSDDLLAKIDKNIIDFDILIATPNMMPKLGKYAKILGPKGLMPSPKSNTVTSDVAKAVKESKAGKIEYRIDSTGIVHASIGKVSFGPEKLEANAKAILASIKNAKPASIKGSYFSSIYITTSMGPSIKVAIIEA